jgi:hypothetical protein
MKSSLRIQFLLAISLVFAAGCSSLPGLRVLTGQETTDTLAEQSAVISDMVMADKSGTTDPSLLAAADRVEAASGIVDIIEIRKDPAADLFTVYLLFQPSAETQDTNEALRRAVELTWQGMMQSSEGSDIVSIKILVPQPVPTLDKGASFVGFVAATFDIARPDAVAYLAHRPNTIADFVDLIAQGRLAYVQPETSEFYEGQPNHPVFMLAQMEAELAVQQSSATSQ